MNLSRHAEQRSQQRGIPRLIVDWLERYGDERYDHNGCTLLYFTKRSLRDLERDVGRQPVRRMWEYMRAYAVVSSDGTVVTVGKRFCRLNNN